MKSVIVSAVISLAFLAPADAASVVNGIKLISQADALAGGVTPGDTAGYPITISVSGSYRLAGNLTPTGGSIGIYVGVPDVTIDLAGFSMLGTSRGSIGIAGAKRSLTVLNGSIVGFQNDAIYAAGPLLMVDHMRLAENGRYGINEAYINATPKTGREDGNTTIKDSIIFHNSQGITCQSACHVEGNVISYNTYSGIIISQSGATVFGNTISNNGGYGVVGNYIGLSNNTIFFNVYCHTSGVMLVGTRNMIYPTANGPYCTELPGN